MLKDLTLIECRYFKMETSSVTPLNLQ